jgi:hypothetical protein
MIFDKVSQVPLNIQTENKKNLEKSRF